jgi:hypothetical protein
MNLLHKLANVLDATADHLDAQTKVAFQQAMAAPAVSPVAPAPEEKKANVKGSEYLSEVYQAVTGSAPDAAVLNKLASDDAMRDTFLKLAEHAAGAESLGGPAEQTDAPEEPKTAEERVRRAGDRFGDWILNG